MSSTLKGWTRSSRKTGSSGCTTQYPYCVPRGIRER